MGFLQNILDGRPFFNALPPSLNVFIKEFHCIIKEISQVVTFDKKIFIFNFRLNAFNILLKVILTAFRENRKMFIKIAMNGVDGNLMMDHTK